MPGGGGGNGDDPLSRWVESIIDAEGLREYIPVLGSCDTRQHEDGAGAGRVCVIDPNRYPQGFNNVWEGDYAPVAGTAADRARCVLTMEGDAAALLQRRIAREMTARDGPPGAVHRVHVVHENYPDPAHPFYRNLACLKHLLRTAFHGAAVTHSLRRVVAQHTTPPTGAVGAPRTAAGPYVTPVSGVYNLLNTSYPSDMLDVAPPHGGWGELDRGGEATDTPGPPVPTNTDPALIVAYANVAAEVEEGVQPEVAPPPSANCAPLLVFGDDPEWYNSYRKSELYSMVHAWLAEMPLDVQAYVNGKGGGEGEGDGEGPAPPATYYVHDCAVTVPSAATCTMEAGFATFPKAVTSANKHELGALLGHLLGVGAPSQEGPRPPNWHKAFVKDEHGCNGVGVCVFGTSGKDAVRVSRKTGAVYVSREHRHALRVRCAKTRSAIGGTPQSQALDAAVSDEVPTHAVVMQRVEPSDDGAAHEPHLSMLSSAATSAGEAASVAGYSLQEGIPSTLRNTATGAVLEVVLMFADGRLFNYFVREGAPAQHHADNCVSLNVPGVRFVQRPEFESAPAYADAFAQVRRRWRRYVCIGRLAMLAMAKQKRDYVANARYRRAEVAVPRRGEGLAESFEDDSTQSESTLPLGTTLRTASEVGDAAGQERSVADSLPLPVPLTAEKFSKEVGGTLLQALNKRAAQQGLQAVKVLAGPTAKAAQPAPTLFRVWAKEVNKQLAALEQRRVLSCLRHGCTTVPSAEREVETRVVCHNRQRFMRNIIADAVAAINNDDEDAPVGPLGAAAEGLLRELAGVTNAADDPSLARKRSEFFRIRRVVWTTIVRCQLLGRDVVPRAMLAALRARGDSAPPAAPAAEASLPCALVPTPVSGLAELVRVSQAAALALDAAACDPEWVCAGLAGAGPWLQRLVGATQRAYGGKDVHGDARVVLTRHEYAQESGGWVQVGVRTAGAVFAGVAGEVAQAHAAAEAAVFAGAGTQHCAGAKESSAAALLAGHRAYERRRGRAGGRICFLVAEGDELEGDHRLLQQAVEDAWGDGKGAPLCFSALFGACDVALAARPGGPPLLLVDGAEVSVAYFRTGFAAADFHDPATGMPSERLWGKREAIEAAACTKVPSLPAQLAGAPAVQHRLFGSSQALTHYLSQRAAEVATLFRDAVGSGEGVGADPVAAAAAAIQKVVLRQGSPLRAGLGLFGAFAADGAETMLNEVRGAVAFTSAPGVELLGSVSVR